MAVTNPGPVTSLVGIASSLQTHATSSGGYPLTFTAAGLPSGLGINSASGLVSGKAWARRNLHGDRHRQRPDRRLGIGHVPLAGQPGNSGVCCGVSGKILTSAASSRTRLARAAASGSLGSTSVAQAGLARRSWWRAPAHHDRPVLVVIAV